MNLIFNTYEELSEFCYPFEKNLGCRVWSVDKKHQLLGQIAIFYRQRLDDIADRLGSRYTLLVHVTMDASYMGMCCIDERIIKLNPFLICCHPLLLTEVIIHELTHYQYAAHGKRFYELMEKNVHRLGMQDVFYGWQDRGIRYPTSSWKLVQLVKEETMDEIRKFFRLSYTSRTRWKPIANGTDLNVKDDWTALTVPAYAHVPQIQGLLNRAEIVHYAERSFRDYIESVAPCFSLDLSGYTVSVSNRCAFDLKERKIELPVWLVGMEPDMRNRFIVTLLTRMDGADKDFRKRLERNLSLTGFDSVPAPSGFCLFQIFKSWETALFDEQGRPKIRYEGTILD